VTSVVVGRARVVTSVRPLGSGSGALPDSAHALPRACPCYASGSASARGDSGWPLSPPRANRQGDEKSGAGVTGGGWPPRLLCSPDEEVTSSPPGNAPGFGYRADAVSSPRRQQEGSGESRTEPRGSGGRSRRGASAGAPPRARRRRTRTRRCRGRSRARRPAPARSTRPRGRLSGRSRRRRSRSPPSPRSRARSRPARSRR
jgi:hypothetical protein